MKKNWPKKDLSKLSKELNKKSIFSEQTKKDDSISISSEDVEEKLNRLIQIKKMEKNNLNQKPPPKLQTKNEIKSTIVKDESKSKAEQEKNIINNKLILNDSEDTKEEIKIRESERTKSNEKVTPFKKNSKKEINNLFNDKKKSKNKDIKPKLEKFIEKLKYIYINNLKSKKLNFFVNLKQTTIEEFHKRGNKKRTTKKKRTQKMLVKKGTVREIIKKEKEQENKKIEEIDEYSFDDEEQLEEQETFINVNNDANYDKLIKTNSQLDEYDLFYKEQFFRNELFRYDVENIQDKEEEDINKQMNKLDCKRRLTAKKKLKEVNDLKGLDTTELAQEIKKLTKEYEKYKKAEEPKVELELNNTEKLLQKGRILGFYFKENQQKDFPHFSMYDFKEKGAKEIIDFKVLRKEEQARRFFDYYCCFNQRKKINEVMVYVRFYCRFLVDNPIFDYLSLLVIIVNTVLILISDPTDNNNYGNITDNYFLYFYTFECILKIIAFKFWASEDAYIRDAWNMLDFFVVVVGWILFIVEIALNGTKISGLAGLRAFRILRPLKTVKRFKSLKKVVTALLLALSHLGETGTVLFFFFPDICYSRKANVARFILSSMYQFKSWISLFHSKTFLYVLI